MSEPRPCPPSRSGREPAEPGIMRRPPRERSEGVIRPPMLLRAWLFLGVICAGLAMAGFFYVLAGRAGRRATRPGRAPASPRIPAGDDDDVPRHGHGPDRDRVRRPHQRASLRSIGVFSNRLLLWGIAFELALSAADHLRAAASGSARHRSARAPHAAVRRAVPVHRLGRRRAPPLAAAPQRPD